MRAFHRFSRPLLPGWLLLGIAVGGWAGAQTTSSDPLSTAHELHRQLLAKPAAERTAADYQAIVALLTRAADDTDNPSNESARFDAASLDLAQARDLDDAAAYKLAADAFLSLLRQHPYTAYRRNAEWALAQIQIFYLHEPKSAAVWLRDFITRYPADPRIAQARLEVEGRTIAMPPILPSDAATATAPPTPLPTPGPATAAVPVTGERAPAGIVAQRPGSPPNLHEFPLSMGGLAGIKVWTNPGATSIVISLHSQLRFERGVVPEIHRVYFDMVGALPQTRAAEATPPAVVDVNDAQVKSVRIAVNRPGVLRVIVETAPGAVVDAGHEFPNPWRFVISVKSGGR